MGIFTPLYRLSHYVRHSASYILCLFSLSVISQNENSNWYFGNGAGLKFSQGASSTLFDGAMNTPEGCSTISDKEGNLLFYTNGATIWNRNHEIMENGSGIAGDIDHTQTSIIIPIPEQDDIYYVFSTRSFPSSSSQFLSGLYLTTVEFTDENPLGEVTSKNTRLIGTSTEKITATLTADGNTIRVVAFSRLSYSEDSPINTFFVFNVTEDGIDFFSPNPTYTATTVEQFLLSSEGAMKISPNGEYLALSNYLGGLIYLYSFDNTDGSISYLTSINTSLFGTVLNPYGIEFSPDSNYIYFSVSNSSTLYQYPLNSNSVLNDKFPIGTVGFSNGSLQLGIDGKIYVANYIPGSPPESINVMSVINKPDKPELECELSQLSVDLSPNGSIKGLPNFIQSYFKNRIIVEDDCVSETFEFSVDGYGTITSVLWEFENGETSTAMTPSHQFASSGFHVVKATITMNNQEIPLYKRVEVYPLPELPENSTLEQCDGDNDGISLFNLYTLGEKIIDYNEDYNLTFFNSLEDAENIENPIDTPEAFENNVNPQELFVRIVSPRGCITISNFFIETTYTNLGEVTPMIVCEDSDGIENNNEGLFNLKFKKTDIRNQFSLPESYNLTYYSSFEDAQTLSNPLDLDYVTISTTIWVRVDNDNSGCSGIEPIDLIVNEPILLDIDEEYTICDPALQPPIILDGGINNTTWLWTNDTGNVLSSSRFFNINTPGTYTITVTKIENGIECFLAKDFIVYQAIPPTFNEIIAENNEIYVSVTGNSSYEFSLDGISYFGQGLFHTFAPVLPGVYTIYVKDLDNCETSIQTNVSFIGYPKYFSPNGDAYNSLWRIYGVSYEFYKSMNIKIYDRYGKNLYSMNLNQNNNYGWDGTYNGVTLNSSDYWFHAVLIDHDNNTHTKSGHFSLIH